MTTAKKTNFEIALQAEMKRVVRRWQAFDIYTQANLGVARLTYSAPTGEFYYVHPAIPGSAFKRRKLAALAALTKEGVA